MYMYPFLIVFLLPFSFSNPPKTIPAVYGHSSHSFNMLLELGSPAKTAYLTIDLSATRSWVTEYVYLPEQSKSRVNVGVHQIRIGYVQYDSMETNDVMRLTKDKYTIEHFHFDYLIGERPEGAYDTISLSYKNEDKKYSIVNQMVEEGLIEHKMFSFAPRDNSIGMLFFGDLPEEEVKNMYKTTCKVNNQYYTWGCSLDKVLIGNEIYQINQESQYIYFNTQDNDILAPATFMDFIREKYLQPYLSDKRCNYQSGTESFYCNCDIIEKLPQIMLIIDGQGVELKGKALFSGYEPKCYLRIRQNNIHKTMWSIGTTFISEHVISFDYDKEEISIYSKSNLNIFLFNFLGVMQLDFIRRLLYVIMLLFVSGIAFLCCLKLKMSKYFIRHKEAKSLRNENFLAQV